MSSWTLKVLKFPKRLGNPLEVTLKDSKSWEDAALQNEILDFPCSVPGKKCLQNIKVFSKLWTYSWNAEIKHSELHRNQSNSSVVGARAGSWFINTSFSWHPRNELPSATSARDPVQSTRGCENLPGFLTTEISDTELCQLSFLAALHHPNVVGYPNKKSVRVQLQNYTKRMKKRLSRVHPGNFLVSTPSPLPFRPREHKHCFGYLLRPFPCSHRDAVKQCQMSWHLLQT